MPRVSGVSLSVTLRFIRMSPMPRNTLRCFSGRPMELFTSVIFSVFSTVSSSDDRLDIGYVLAPQGRNLTGGPKPAEPAQGRLDEVVGVVGTQAFCEHVLHAGHFQHGTNGAACDEARSFRGGFQEHPARAEFPDDLVGDRAVADGDLRHALAGLLHPLADRFGYLVGLAQARSDGTLAVADNHDGAEAEPPAALHDLGRPVDGHNTVQDLRFFHPEFFSVPVQRSLPILSFGV